MFNFNFWPVLYVFLLILSLPSVINCSSCTFGTTNLSELNRTWDSMSDDGNITYQISLCKAVVPNGPSDHSCHGDTSVCMLYKNSTVLSGGNFSSENMTSQGNEKGELWLIMGGDPCLESPGDNMTTLLGLKCGPTLGGPKFLDHTYCVSYFLWETDIMCKGDIKPTHEEKCYLYDDDGNRYDLSPLAKKKGGYHAMSSDSETEIYINICRDIVPDGATVGCPAGHAACAKKKTGGNVTMMGVGEVTQPLKMATDKGLTLHYGSSNDAKKEGCTDAPTTTINFICPKRGGSKDPVLESDFNCQYVINWQTEYACPEAVLTSKTCKLTKEDADIDIDLTPLTKPPGSKNPYKVTYTEEGGTTYDYYLNVCGELNIPCPDQNHTSNIPACQLKPDDIRFGKPMGSTHEMLLRYADGELTLTYKGGQPCHHNNLQRTTVINFICNKSAEDDGRGKPVFSEYDDCVYIFDWGTKYACTEHPLGEDCDVSHGGKNYDLSRLVKMSGDNWVALQDGDPGSYYINICHDIIPQSDTPSCTPGTAICYRDGGLTRNLGQYASAPTYQASSNSLQLNYTNGDPCGDNKLISSVISFFCKPGHLESQPTLIRKSADRCVYEFEWHTAAACPLGSYIGNDCKVSDSMEGFSFDLSPLKASNGDYKVSTDPNYDFFLNVCGPLTGTDCDGNDIKDPGVCQVTKDKKHSFVTGQFSSELHYFDGLINLTYTGGTPYNDVNHTPRKSEIAFLCDPTAGKGKPVYINEAAGSYTYSFEWYTSYACPEQAIECTASDPNTGAEYDLTGLSMPSNQGNWAVDGMNNKKYYINVCRSLNKVDIGDGCGPFTSICRTSLENGMEKIDIPDLGHVTSGPVVLGEGRLKLTYKSLATCPEGNGTSPYITHIQFVCEKSAVVSTPSVPRKDGPCEYTILWNTVAACPIVKDVETELCTVKDPNSDYVFNLQPLTKKDGGFYDVNATDAKFKLNICGMMTSDVCDKNASVCYLFKDGTKKVVSYETGTLEFSETGHMALMYEGADRLANGQRVNVIINFECDRDIDLGSPEFQRMEETAYILTFKTALACPPAFVDCLVQDKAGNQYDLGTLYRSGGWRAYDASKGNSYYINICNAINNMTFAHCPAGPIGGCQLASNGHSYNMGYIQSKPIAREDGTLSLRYMNGDLCHKGTKNQAHRSTRINFFCSRVNGGLMFLTETETCEYVFTWQTPAACPLKRTVGAHCKVVEPLFNFEFNLNPLQKQGNDYHVHDQDNTYEYVLNICGPLTRGGVCGSSSDVAVCQTKPSDSDFTPVVAGKANSTLVYSGGELTLMLTGGKDNCHGSYTRQTLIKFSCSHSTDGRSGPKFIEESQNCQYIFDWPTRYACPPFKTGECTVKDSEGRVYDLTSLALTDNNYETTDTVEKKRYVLNVCRSLVHKKGTTCPYDAAACMIDLEAEETPEKYHNIGEVNSHQVQVINGALLLVYNHGEVCPKNQSLRVTTHIHMKCVTSVQESRPTGHFMVNDCFHHFMWATPAACPISGTKPVVTTNATCKLTSPRTGAVFDLTGLRINGENHWKVTDGENHLYEFNVCGPVLNSTCKDKSSLMGVCQSETQGQKRTFSAGNVVSDIYYDDGIVILNYTGGDRCHNNQYERNTIISFVCSIEGLGKPVYIDETMDCTYYISWHTNLVCEHQVKCTVDIDSQTEIDLTALTNMPYQLVRSAENEVYYVSICQPLKPIPGTLCPAGAASCLVRPGEKKPLSLGKPRSPTWNPVSKELVLIYPNGSQCETDRTLNYSTRIVFKCRPGPHKGSPVLVASAGCEYVFQWDTNQICFEEKPSTPKDFCGYRDPQTLAVYNLTDLRTTSPYEVKVPGSDKKFYMNMCGPADPTARDSCKKAMVCRDGISYGDPKNYQVVKESDQFKLTYANGETCASGQTARSHILFSCDRSGLGTPQFSLEIDCYAVFTWRTSVVCPPVEDKCFTMINGHLYDLTLLSRDKGSWSLTDANGNKYWINICASVHGSPCSGDVGICRQTKDGKYDSLGRASTATGLTKGKDGSLILEYTEGSPVCTETARRSNNQPSRTVITFICGKTYGGPVFVNRSDDCVFNFKWETKLACQVKKEEVHDVDGIVKDPRSGGVINLNPLLNRSFEVHTKDNSGGDKTYMFQLNGESRFCDDGAVCQQINNKNQYRVLGLHAQRKLYMTDDILEVEYNSTEFCKGSQGKKLVSSVIQFRCNKDVPIENPPELLYSSKDCMYVFSWETKVACVNVTVEITPGGSANANNKGPGGGMQPKTVGAVVGVFLAVIIICILLVVFHNADRRAACMLRLRKIVHHRSSEYTQLPSESTNLLDEEEEVLTFNDPSEPDIRQETSREDAPIVTVEPQRYHDDSDEDLLS